MGDSRSHNAPSCSRPPAAKPWKRPKKKNAYVVFVDERRREEEARGTKMPKDLDAIFALFSDEWASMDECDREPYKTIAQNINVKNGYRPNGLNEPLTPEELARRWGGPNAKFDGGQGKGGGQGQQAGSSGSQKNALGEDWSSLTKDDTDNWS